MARFIFVTIANRGMVKLTRNMIRTIRAAGMNNPVVVACMDDKTRQALSSIEGVSLISVEDQMATAVRKKYQAFGTIEFQDMMKRKYPAVRMVMEDSGKDAIYVDSDIGFWRDINEYFLKAVRTETDILCSVEPDNIGFCCGFTYFTNRPATFDFIDLVILEKRKAFKSADKFIGEQAVFNDIANNDAGCCPATVVRLPETEFCNGHYLKTPGRWTKDGKIGKGVVRKDMYLAHANWMVGHQKKIRFLKLLGLYQSENWWSWFVDFPLSPRYFQQWLWKRRN